MDEQTVMMTGFLLGLWLGSVIGLAIGVLVARPRVIGIAMVDVRKEVVDGGKPKAD